MITLALVAVVTWIDYATGYEISLFFLYLAPLACGAWFLGLPAGLGVSALVTLGHRWADWSKGLHYSHPWIAWERALANFVLCSFIVFSIHTFRRGRKIDRERIQQLKELLRVCPSCNRVNYTDGQWKDLNACLGERPTKPPETKLCPDCAAAREVVDYPSI